jgi:choline dehydrogenase-like flavoprotein
MSPPTRFGTAYRDRMRVSRTIDVYLHANVLELVVDESGTRVVRARCGVTPESQFTVSAPRFVLAAGGIENARVLLASRSRRSAGLGNENDVVGRYFMDHLQVVGAGQVVFGRPEDVESTFYGFWSAGALTGRGAIRPTDATLRNQRLLNAGLVLWATPLNEAFRDEGPRSEGVNALVEWVRALTSGGLPDEAWSKTCLAVADRREVFRFASRRLRRALGSSGGTLEASIAVEAEQTPNRDSRVTLTSEADAFGVPRVQLDWRVTPQDLDSIRSLLGLMGQGAGASGLGRFRAAFSLETEQPEVKTTYHHMGTTRMGTDPRTSVVDADARVHTVDNLYVAGSSVFPTGGRSNPTLTIVALALRLADHLTGSGAA